MGKRTVILSLLLVWFSLGGSAAAVLVVDNASPDLGEVLAGQVVTHTCTLSNPGDATLLITKVQAACGCTVPSWEQATLPPGSSIPLEATFSTRGYSGRVIKTVYVYYRRQDETATTTLKLSLSATVLKAQPYDLVVSEFEHSFILLIDLRDADVYTASHLMGALSVPYADLANWVGALPRDVFTVVYDQDDTLAAGAAGLLREAEYRETHPLRGGMDVWRSAYGSRFVTAGASAAERFLPIPEGRPSASSSDLRSVDPSYLNEELLVLVDLRSPDAYDAAHLAGAVNVQPAVLSDWVAQLPTDTQLVLCDEDGSVARPQAIALFEAGFKRAQALFGGLAEWRAAFGGKLLVTIAP